MTTYCPDSDVLHAISSKHQHLPVKTFKKFACLYTSEHTEMWVILLLPHLDREQVNCHMSPGPAVGPSEIKLSIKNWGEKNLKNFLKFYKNDQVYRATQCQSGNVIASLNFLFLG